MNAPIGKILITSPFPYGSKSGHGGAAACFAAVRLLAHSYRVGMVTFSRGSPEEAAAVDELRGVLEFVEVVPLHIGKVTVFCAKLGGLLGTEPEIAAYHRSPVMAAKLRDAVARFVPDWVLLQFPPMAQYVGDCGAARTIMDVQDAYSVSWYRRTTSARGLVRKELASREWLNWVRFERRHYGSFDQVWAVSEQDRWGLTAFNPKLRPHVLGPPVTDAVRIENRAVGDTVGFIGSFRHEPNVEALAFLIDEVLPRLRGQCPSARLVIAGRNPPEAIVVTAPRSVEFVGFVESLWEFYAKCKVIVAPLLSGGGIKIKVVEALMHGAALVTTSVGAEGIGIVSGEHAEISDDASSFANSVALLLTDAARRETYRTHGRALAAKNFSAQQWITRVRGLVEGDCNRQVCAEVRT